MPRLSMRRKIGSYVACDIGSHIRTYVGYLIGSLMENHSKVNREIWGEMGHGSKPDHSILSQDMQYLQFSFLIILRKNIIKFSKRKKR